MKPSSASRSRAAETPAAPVRETVLGGGLIAALAGIAQMFTDLASHIANLG